MEPLIRFFIEVGKLKSIQRRGWLLRGIKNPETVADHAFRVLVLAWLLGFGTKLKIKRLLKLALVHSLSAVYIDYITPYDKLLEIKTRKEVTKYPALILRASLTEKGKIVFKRFEEEKRAVDKLTSGLPESIKTEIRYLWLDYQEKSSPEARFLGAIDKLENLIQALEYKGQIKEDVLKPFLSQIDRVTDDKKILKFAESLNEYFYKGEKGVKNRHHGNLIKFILDLGKLKTMPRKGWLIRGVKNPESIASHSFVAAIISWILSTRRRVDQEVIFMMFPIHDVSAVEIGDITPHDVFIEKIGDVKKVIETFPWIGLKQEKEVIMREQLKRKSVAVDKLFKNLAHSERHELKYLWLEFETGTSAEGRFARQIDRIETVIQAMEYHKKDKNVSPTSFWLGLKELIDDQRLLELVESLDTFYYQKKSEA